MISNEYLVTYATKGEIYQEPLNTFEIIIYLILSKFNKKVDLFTIEYNKFLSDDEFTPRYSCKEWGVYKC